MPVRCVSAEPDPFGFAGSSPPPRCRRGLGALPGAPVQAGPAGWSSLPWGRLGLASLLTAGCALPHSVPSGAPAGQPREALEEGHPLAASSQGLLPLAPGCQGCSPKPCRSSLGLSRARLPTLLPLPPAEGAGQLMVPGWGDSVTGMCLSYVARSRGDQNPRSQKRLRQRQAALLPLEDNRHPAEGGEGKGRRAASRLAAPLRTDISAVSSGILPNPCGNGRYLQKREICAGRNLGLWGLPVCAEVPQGRAKWCCCRCVCVGGRLPRPRPGSSLGSVLESSLERGSSETGRELWKDPAHDILPPNIELHSYSRSSSQIR